MKSLDIKGFTKKHVEECTERRNFLESSKRFIDAGFKVLAMFLHTRRVAIVCTFLVRWLGGVIWGVKLEVKERV